MKRIAWILDTFPSRSETFIARDILALRDCGLPIEVFALQAGEGARAMEKQGRLRADWNRTGAVLGKTLASEGFGHVHAGWASYPTEIARAAAQVAGLTWSFSGHARDLWVEGRDWKDKLARAAFAHSCTRAGAAFLAERGHATEIIYAPHGLDLAEWPFDEHVRSSAPVLLGVGRLVPKKGWDVWLRALALMQNSAPQMEWSAALIGDGPGETSLRKLMRELKLEHRLHLRGALPSDQVRREMQAAGLLVFSGHDAPDGDRDGLPNVLLEAAALGLPLVATRAGSIEEFGIDAMRLCDPDDPAALSIAMQDALCNSAASSDRARLARRTVEERFALEIAICPLAAAFFRVLNK